MENIFYVQEVRDLFNQYYKEEISLSRLTEILNEKANKNTPAQPEAGEGQENAFLNVNRFNVQDNRHYMKAVDDYLENGIEYSANTICKADKGDIEQLAMDSFCEGAQFILDAIDCNLFAVSQSKTQLAAQGNVSGVEVKALQEILEAFQWTWENTRVEPTADHFNIPANGIEQLQKFIAGYSANTSSELPENDLKALKYGRMFLWLDPMTHDERNALAAKHYNSWWSDIADEQKEMMFEKEHGYAPDKILTGYSSSKAKEENKNILGG